MKSTRVYPHLPSFISTLLIITLVLAACSITDQPDVTQIVPETTDSQPYMLVELDFETTLPEPIPTGQLFALEILDEVTGLALNPQHYTMTAVNPTTYSLKLSVPSGSVIKYRYVQEGTQTAIEYNSIGKQVRYRLFNAINPAKLQDTVLAWNSLPYQGNYGRIQGRVVNAVTGAPVPASMVAVGGQVTLTASDGSFLVDRMPPGTHILVVYSLDGSHQVFQQQAEVAVESATPADIKVDPSEFVKVSFVVDPPDGNPPGIPIRLIGNIAPLGNSFSDLRGGISGISSRAPLLKYTDSGKYTLELDLPAGLDLRYKYTLGDGFWNAERSQKQEFTLRQLIIPSQPITIDDKIVTWKTEGKEPITFKVTVPPNTPPGDTISIQFNPYGWTEPIPMWPLGENNWLYVLYNPLDLIDQASFRYCRNEQCNIADDIKTKGPDASGKLFAPEDYSQVIDETITEWNWSAPALDPITVPSGEIQAKPQEFITGIELAADYHPSWQPYFNQAFESISRLRSDWVILSPTWHFTSTNPPVVNIVPGVDASWYDMSQTITAARNQDLRIALHPTTSYYQPPATWWIEATRDRNWWQSWFDRYETFILHHADLATQAGVEVLILGDENILPALPNGTILDNPSGVPDYAEARWREIFSKVRSRFTGKLGWYLVYPDGYANIPPFLDSVDQLYVVMAGKLSDAETPTSAELTAAATEIFENDLRVLRDRFDRPVLLGIAYPSAKGAASGCIRSADACLPPIVFTQGGLDIPSVELDVRGQAEIYNAVLQAVSTNNWLAGVFSVGFYPPVKIADQSLSIFGKPASDVTWFWFDHFIPIAQ
jgi:hypothetical protein